MRSFNLFPLIVAAAVVQAQQNLAGVLSSSDTAFNGSFSSTDGTSLAVEGTYDASLPAWTSATAEISYTATPNGTYPYTGTVNSFAQYTFNSTDGSFGILAWVNRTITDPVFFTISGYITITPV